VLHQRQRTVAPGFEPLAELFDKTVAGSIGGGALVVRRRGETVVDLWKGYADPAAAVPWTPDTLAISFSTSKGVASTVVHRLAERGELAYDEPVASYWPAFGAAGKGRITVRQLLSHRAGLYDVQAVARQAEDLLDHAAMEDRLAAQPSRDLGRPAYHAITYGWLIAGLCRAITGREVAAPLGTDGIFIGRPADRHDDTAELVGASLRRIDSVGRVMAPVWSRIGFTRASHRALYVPGFHRLFEGRDAPIWTTEMPAVNGAFTADGLARLYGALANAGDDGSGRLLSAGTVHTLGRVQTRQADAVLGLRMRWRLGYHHAFGTGRDASHAFGHYGFGGSGAWADPSLGLSFGFVTNTVGRNSTPVADARIFRLSALARRCAT
jgi:CubicO group peptidase (beta-lactamase class C family)